MGVLCCCVFYKINNNIKKPFPVKLSTKKASKLLDWFDCFFQFFS